MGGSIAAAPAAALELGELKVHSALGQPLRASISYALGPNEAISETCVSLLPSAPGGGVPSVSRGSVAIRDGVIAITGSTIVREPMVTMRVSIRCQYTPRLIRDYLLLVNPSQPKGAAVVAPTPARVASQPQLAQPPVIRQSTPVRPQPAAQAPIEDASRYQVQAGDSLSQIAQRIENRPVELRTAVNAIFAANPDAFIDNNPDRLKAGSWLTIPNFGAAAPAPVAVAVHPAAPHTSLPTSLRRTRLLRSNRWPTCGPGTFLSVPVMRASRRSRYPTRSSRDPKPHRVRPMCLLQSFVRRLLRKVAAGPTGYSGSEAPGSR
jgi:pilus assembly protein FimV